MTSIYVGHLSDAATEEDLRATFEQYGSVHSVNIIMDRATGRPRGYAFIEMDSGAEAAEAIEKLNGRELAGRKVKVNKARPNEGRRRRRDESERDSERS